MKGFSRLILIYMTFLLMFSLTGCSDSNFPKAEESIKGFFEALNKSDFKTAESYCTLTSSDDFNFGDEKGEKLAKLLYARTKYEIVSSKEEGSTATVKIKVSNLDFSKVFETMMTDIISEITEAAFKGEDISDDKAEEMTMKLLEESFSKPDAPVITKELDVTLHKDKKKKIWIIQDDETFVKGVIGNVSEMLSSVSD